MSRGGLTRSRHRAATFAIATLVLLTAHALGAAAAAPKTLWQGCATGSGPGHCFVPTGIGVEPTTGRLYVADGGNDKVHEFTAWGQLIREWGSSGQGSGQFSAPRGVVVDPISKDVYVVDGENHRVQKFDSEGHFILMFGGEVDKTTNANICAQASGDTCGIGVVGTGNGQFEPWRAGSFIALAPGGVYVGDKERIQLFDSGGSFVENIPVPDQELQSLTSDPSGNLYLAYFKSNFFGERSKPDVVKIDPTRANPIGEALCTAKVKSPRALATDASGSLYVVDGETGSGLEMTVRKFNPSCEEVKDGTYPFTDGFDLSFGIATDTVTQAGGVALYVANAQSTNSYVRAYYPPPDKPLPFDPPPLVPPSIASQLVLSANTDSAVVKARINPHFLTDTRYYVEYGTGKCSEGGCPSTSQTPPGALLGSEIVSEDLATAGVFLSNLTPATTYYYRFVAQSLGGGPVRGVGGEVGKDGAEGTFTTFGTPGEPTTDCPNQGFRTAAAASLPDCRAYEMVSPLEKNNGDAQAPFSFIVGPVGGRETEGRIDQATPGGEKLTYATQRSFGDSASAGWSSQYVASRGAGGWSTEEISPPRGKLTVASELATETQFRAFAPDLCSAWIVDDTNLELAPGAPTGVPNLYRRDECGEGGYELLTSVPPPGFGNEGVQSQYVPVPQAILAGGTRTIFHAPAKLTEKACEPEGKSSLFPSQLYESTEGGPLRLVSALPNGKGTCQGASLGTAQAGRSADFRGDNVATAVSEDGSRAYWTESDAESYGGAGTIYLRTNPDQPQSAIKEGKCTQPERACTIAVSGVGSTFLAAAPSGSPAIYQTGANLYEAEIGEEGGQVVSHSTLIAEGVKGILGASKDTTRIYLVSGKVLAAGGTEGKANLYLREAGGGTRFVARLGDMDGPNGGAKGAVTSYLSPFNYQPSYHSARVTPDGLHLAFTSRGTPTGYDNSDANSGEPDAEVYLYDASANGGEGRLVCASCNPSGALPVGRNFGRAVESAPFYWAAAAIPGWETQFQPSRVLSEDGNRLFFESYEPLVLADTNGKQDVYEWEAAGSGNCEEASGSYSQSAGGCVSLISSGESPEDSEFLDASADARDVFFATSSSLLPQDSGLVDIYDAREGGGFPPPASPAPTCEGEACQGTPAAPNDPTPGSSSFEGAGNVVEKPAKKKAHKKKAHKKKTKAKKHKAKRRADHKRRANR